MAVDLRLIGVVTGYYNIILGVDTMVEFHIGNYLQVRLEQIVMTCKEILLTNS